MAEASARSARKQQEGFRALAQELAEAYEGRAGPESYAAGRLAGSGGQQLTRQGLWVAEEVTERTEEATREAELRASVLTSLESDDYDALTVAEVTEKLGDFPPRSSGSSASSRSKDRESLVERIDRKIRANS